MARKQIPIVSGWREPDVNGLIYEFCENMYPVSYDGNSVKTVAMLPSPGNQRFYKILQDVPSSQQVIRGMIVMNGFVWVVIHTYLVKLAPLFGGRILTGFAETVYDGVAPSTDPVRMASANNFELGFVDGTYIYSYSTVSDTLINATVYVNSFSTTQGSPSKTYTTALSIPYHAKDIAFLANRFVVTMDYSAQFFVSYDVPGTNTETTPFTTTAEQLGRRLTRVTTTDNGTPAVISTRWTFGSMSQKDDLQAVAVNNGNMYLFGRLHTQTWTNAGLASLPFQPIQGQTYNYGAASTYTVDTAVNASGVDITVFISQDKHGALSCISIGQGGAQKLSNKQVEGFWAANVTNGFDAIGFFFRDKDDLFYQITFPTDNLTFVYDFERNEWQRRLWTDLGRHKANCFVHFNDSRFNGGWNLMGDFESGWLYDYSSNYYTYEDSKTTFYPKGSQLNGVTLNSDTTADNTALASKATKEVYTAIDIPKVCVSPIFDDPDGKTITVSMAEVEYITGESRGDENIDIYTEDADPVIKMRISTDRGRTYGEPIDGTIGKQGDYKKRVVYYGIGSSHDGFVFKLQSYSKYPIIILKLIVEFQVGEN